MQCAKCGESWYAQPITDDEPAEAELEAAGAGAGAQAALPSPDKGESGASPAERAAARAAAVDDDDAGMASAPQATAPHEDAFSDDMSDAAARAAADTDATDAAGEDTDVAETGAAVTSLPQQARRRRRWRDLRDNAADDDLESGAPEEALGAQASTDSGADPFAERLARLRQASLAPDPMPRSAQEQTLRRRRGEDEGERTAGDFAERAAFDESEDRAQEYDDAGDGEGSLKGAEAARAQLEAEEAAAPAGSDGAGEPRNEQMAEIRRMLDEMKVPGSEARGSEEAERAFARERDVAGIEKMAPGPMVERRRDEYADPLREKLLDPQTKAKRQGTDGERQRAGLMRKHQKRNRRRQMAEKTRRSRGGFYTGLLLVLGAIGMLAAVYAYADVIKDKLPGTRAAIDDYVASVDRGRADLGRRLVALEQRVDEIIKVMSE